LNENFRRCNFQAFPNISGKFPEILFSRKSHNPILGSQDVMKTSQQPKHGTQAGYVLQQFTKEYLTR